MHQDNKVSDNMFYLGFDCNCLLGLYYILNIYWKYIDKRAKLQFRHDVDYVFLFFWFDCTIDSTMNRCYVLKYVDDKKVYIVCTIAG